MYRSEVLQTVRKWAEEANNLFTDKRAEVHVYEQKLSDMEEGLGQLRKELADAEEEKGTFEDLYETVEEGMKRMIAIENKKREYLEKRMREPVPVSSSSRANRKRIVLTTMDAAFIPVCEGCKFDFQNQEGHMGEGGCLHHWEPRDLNDDDEILLSRKI